MKKEYVKEEKDVIILGNQFLEVEFNKKNGTILGLKNKHTGKDYILKKELAKIFRLVVPLKDWLGHHIDASNQKLNSFQLKKSEEAMEVIFKYSKLETSYGSFDINVRYGAFITDDPALTFWIEIQNNSQNEVTEVWFPWIGGRKRLGIVQFISCSSIYR
jgi:hypothetical protein